MHRQLINCSLQATECTVAQVANVVPTQQDKNGVSNEKDRLTTETTDLQDDDGLLG